MGTAPVKAFPANGFGLYQMAGNVWEWTADPFHVSAARTWCQGDPRRLLPLPRVILQPISVAARTGNTPDSSTGNTGFRIAADLASDAGKHDGRLAGAG